jgi:hypothetical protein
VDDAKRLIYKSKYSVGEKVRVASREMLETFLATWRYHHKLQREQLEFGGTTAEVSKVGFYHGGDVLYELNGVPGIWHEACLENG